MPQIVISDIEEEMLERLARRASAHGRTAEAEAREILRTALPASVPDPWSAVDGIRSRLAAAGGPFGDCVELIRADRER